MPGYLLHSGASVICAHAGTASPTSVIPRVKVAGQPITTMAAPYSVAGCPFNVSGAPSPCVTGQWVTGATRVSSGGSPVLLQDSQAVCAPNGTPLTVTSVQLRVKGV
jgi:uncharacterized Zn-binding protein involved in type VI secretion